MWQNGCIQISKYLLIKISVQNINKYTDVQQKNMNTADNL